MSVEESSDDHTFSVEELLDFVSNDTIVAGGFSLAYQARTNNTKQPQNTCNGDTLKSDRLQLSQLKVDHHSDSEQENLDPTAALTQENGILQNLVIAKRKRNRRADKSSWKRVGNEMLRMKGEDYVGYKVEVSPSSGVKTNVFGAHRPARKLDTRCRSSYCFKRSKLKCNEFSEQDRRDIFKMFWKSMDWGQKKSYVISLVDTIPVKRKANGSKERRKYTQVYYLKLNEQKVQVCRRMFLSTLGLKKDNVLKWLKSGCNTSGNTTTPPKGKGKRKEPSKHAERFLDEIPKLPSHYCRSTSKKLYLEPDINSKSELYGLYKAYCADRNLPVCSRFVLSKLIEEKNIGLFSPRKDQCDICVSHETGQVDEVEFARHISNKEQARDQKTKDKIEAYDGKCHVLTMDLQAVKVCPMLKASSLYYKTKLIVHNFTIYNLKTQEGVCYWWDETEGDLSSSVFATCVSDFISQKLKDRLPIIIYSDGCTAQNRNTQMANCLLEIAISQNRIITQKFLEKGHTQMECDSMHSAIESEMKNKTLYLPHDYVKLSSNAREGNQYEVKHLDHSFFKDYTMKKSQRYLSIRPGEKKGDACVTDLRLIRYDPAGYIKYKLSYASESWADFPHRPKVVLCPVTPRLFQNRLRISGRKFKDLHDIKAVIPKQFHLFYDNLPFEASK